MLQKLLQLILNLLRPFARESESKQQPAAAPAIADKKGRRRINSKGRKLIKDFEGCKLEAYQDIVGVWTIGYGHINTAKEGMKIDEKQAEALLEQDLQRYEEAVETWIQVPLTDNQFAALVSFSFNLGVNALRESTLRKLLNHGDYNAAAIQFARWNKARGREVAGLTRRRRAEAELFLTPDGN